MAAFRVGVTSIVTSQTSGGRGTGLAPAAAWRYHAVHEGDASGRHECNLTKSSTATRISSPERMRGRCDVLITMDHGIEFQQPIASFPFGIVIVRAASNRITPGRIQRVGARR